MHGVIAWFAWAFIHITFLAQLSLKISVFLQWAWLFLTGQRGSRLIVNQPTEAAQATISRGTSPEANKEGHLTASNGQ